MHGACEGGFRELLGLDPVRKVLLCQKPETTAKPVRCGLHVGTGDADVCMIRITASEDPQQAFLADDRHGFSAGGELRGVARLPPAVDGAVEAHDEVLPCRPISSVGLRTISSNRCRTRPTTNLSMSERL